MQKIYCLLKKIVKYIEKQKLYFLVYLYVCVFILYYNRYKKNCGYESYLYDCLPACVDNCHAIKTY